MYDKAKLVRQKENITTFKPAMVIALILVLVRIFFGLPIILYPIAFLSMIFSILPMVILDALKHKYSEDAIKYGAPIFFISALIVFSFFKPFLTLILVLLMILVEIFFERMVDSRLKLIEEGKVDVVKIG